MTNSNGPTTESRAAMYDLAALGPFLLDSYSDGLGRIAWATEHAPAIAHILAENLFAIVRVELWCLCDDNTHTPIIPFVDGRASMLQWILDTGWDTEREDWAAFCARCLAAAMPFLTDRAYEASLTDEWGPLEFRFYMDAANEAEYVS